ncbi:LIM and calponin homology domains-containing protein 1 isoform X2 [Kryptolebias marmoratus]|uniref:LIM and calponin homology domains-containing protein 1 isoform X2 n=1 Tax=Kryptolebias marmoratus TaxID=37003 RepID=UPI0007F8925E|nr:LIM and calponin homology domains-containing protein 1 isoform X2 [Kryptolebias marmoratus]
MASPAACGNFPSGAPPREPQEPPTHHPEPACLEAQKWIEAVTGKSFGDRDFRSALENGILLCELLSAIKPGLVKKINRLPTPIAGLDNLSVFLRGCEELGLKGSQLFDPGDLQDTSIRANLKDSDCSRKLKNVLNTVFWLGKAASGCASYSGPTLNLKEFEGLLAQMKVESEEGGDSLQQRSVRDSGYDCWDSERSESLSPPRHTRDNSLDSLDSFGSRSQQSPSPDVVNRGNSDGRCSDSEADASGRKPDVRKDDMLARRTASSESRCSVPFNQFLPNRTNASSYIPAPRRKQHTEEIEQRSHPRAAQEQSKRGGLHNKPPKTVTWAPENNGEKVKQVEDMEVLEQRRLQKLEKAGIKVLPAAVRYISPPITEEKEVKPVLPSIVLRSENDFLSSHKSAWDSPSDGEEDTEKRKVPDVLKDDLASRRVHRGPVVSRVHQFLPAPACTNKDRERWEDIRRASQRTLQERDISEKEAVPDIITRKDNPFLKEEEGEKEDEGEEGKDKVMPNKQNDDLARRRAQSKPLPHRDGPMSFVSSSMSPADMQKWERLKMTEPSEDRPAPVCQACLQRNYRSPFSGSAKARRGHSKVVTFGGVTEIEQPVDKVTSREGEEAELLRRLLSKATVAMPTIDLGSQLSERERSHADEAEPCQSTPPPADLHPWTLRAPFSAAELDARLAQYEQRTEDEDEEEEEEERIPDLQKDDMMARRTGVFQKQTPAAVNPARFLPLPGSKKRCTPGEVTTDAAPRSKKQVQAERKKELGDRLDHLHPRVPRETPQAPELTAIQSTPHVAGEQDDSEDEYGENEPVPDLEKDDMMARRTRSFQKASEVKANQCFNQFLPVPGSVKHNISPAPAATQPRSWPKLEEDPHRDSSIVTVAAERQAPPLTAPSDPARPGPMARQEEEEEEEPAKGETVKVADLTVSGVSEPLRTAPLVPPPSPPPPPPPPPPPAQIWRVEAETESQKVEEKAEVEERKEDGKPQKKPFWLEDDLPPIMVSRRVAFQLGNESVSMGDMGNEEEVVGHLPSLSQSRYERMQEQYNNFLEEEDHWQDDLARWKNRRRSASQELIKKEEERKRIEKRMKDKGGDGNKRKSIKTYKEIVEEKERREAELCDAYRNAATPEEAALVLQRYALRFTISDATLDSLKLPRSTLKPKQDLDRAEREHELASPDTDSEMLGQPHKPDLSVTINQKEEHAQPEDMETDPTHEEEKSSAISASSTAPDSSPSMETNSLNVPPESVHHQETRPTESPPAPRKQPTTEEPRAQTKDASPQTAQAQLQPERVIPSPPSAPSRPLPLLVAKPYCQPRSTTSGHKPVKLDGLVRVNGEATEDFPSPRDMLQENKDVSSERTERNDPPREAVEKPSAAEQPAPPQPEKSASFPGSAISSLIGGRNCIITTTIVTELTQTRVEPLHPDAQSKEQDGMAGLSDASADEKTPEPAASPSSNEEYSPTVTEGLEESGVTIETPMLNLAKRVNHWVWDPNEERKRVERWQQEQERLLQEQYQREQEKLKKEWEMAQLEVKEEERKHNEEERRILEETVAPLSPSGVLHQQAGHTNTVPSENSNTEGEHAPLQQNGQRISTGGEEQHASKLHFFQDSSCDGEPSKKQELWKTASLDRNPQLTQTQSVKRSESHNAVTSKQPSSPPAPQPPSPSWCVSGRRLCSGCSKPLGKGAAMIIDTLGLFFHIQCFKCGACRRQMGDATTGTDVRIRNGQLSCYECYIASRGRGQPTTL